MKSAFALVALLLGTTAGSNAATTVLYQTDWEAAPPWALGAINGQNSWTASASGFQVVSNGSPGAVIGAQSVVTPYGRQFVRAIADPTTSASNHRYGWPDISAAVAGLPANQKMIKASFDVFVPGSQALDGSYYGIRAWHESSAPWGLFVEADDQSVNLVIGTSIAYVPGAFEFDTWFNIKVIADYSNGNLSVEKDGASIDLSGNSPGILSGTLQDIDLWTLNSAAPPTVRAAFMDNYRVTAEGPDASFPKLAIQVGAIGEWHLSWSAAFSNWILESTQNITSPTWTNEFVTPVVAGGVASVNLPNAPPRTFFRLRKP